jgi:hypothetical protein
MHDRADINEDFTGVRALDLAMVVVMILAVVRSQFWLQSIHWHLSMSAVGVPQLPGKLIVLPPMVRDIQCGSSFSG